MTDPEALSRVLEAIDPAGGSMAIVKRNGRLLLALPTDGAAARRALRLYQPQRRAAKVLSRVVEWMIGTSCHSWLMPKFTKSIERSRIEPSMPKLIEGTCGVMLGSPEHRVRRAIASYQTASGWEVAKTAFGPEGWDVIRGEVEALKSLPEGTPGAPTLLGVHRNSDISLMRMPYFQGRVLAQGDSAVAIALLESWNSDLSLKAMTEFPEWPEIQSALSNSESGEKILNLLSAMRLRPVIRHGDFARWNLLRITSGDLMVLDWEWGTAQGMPGIDLVHFFAQDARLVQRLSPAEVIQSVEQSLQQADCRNYLENTGWRDDVRLAILASIAFTVGAKQQNNEAVLKAALTACL